MLNEHVGHNMSFFFSSKFRPKHANMCVNFEGKEIYLMRNLCVCLRVCVCVCVCCDKHLCGSCQFKILILPQI